MASPARQGVDWDAPLPATWLLVAAIGLVHVATGLWQWWVGYEGLADALFLGRSTRFRVAVGGQFRPLVAEGEYWRLWTSVLLHGDALHLLVNAVSLVALGRLIEPWIGALRTLGWFFVGGLAGAALSQAVGLLQSDGASGGAFALLGAVVVLAHKRRDSLPEEDRRLLGPVLWGFLALNVVLSFALPFVNAAGHIGGLLAGLLLAVLWRGNRRYGTIAWALLALGSAAVCGVGWLF